MILTNPPERIATRSGRGSKGSGTSGEDRDEGGGGGQLMGFEIICAQAQDASPKWDLKMGPVLAIGP